MSAFSQRAGSWRSSQRAVGPTDCCVTAEPVRSRIRLPASSVRSSSTSTEARASFCWIDGLSGRPAASSRTRAGTIPLNPTAAISCSCPSSRQSEQTFSHHVAGSCSAQAGCGVASSIGRSACASTPLAGSRRTPFVALVPISRPRSRLTSEPQRRSARSGHDRPDSRCARRPSGRSQRSPRPPRSGRPGCWLTWRRC